MPKVDEKQIAVARVYSKSMLSLAESKGQAGEFLAELEEVLACIDRDPRFAIFLTSPLIDARQREVSIEKIFRGKASDLLVNSLQVLGKKGRLGMLPAITEAYREQYQTLRGKVDVLVRTATPLTERLRHRLKASIEALAGKEPNLIEEVDELLIGGMVLKVGDQKIDASVLRQLHELREMFHRRAVAEIFKARQAGEAASA